MTFWRTWPWVAALAGFLSCGSPPAQQETPPPAPSLEAAVGEEPATPVLTYAEREGRALFAHYCAGCHGTNGQGDGFNAYNLDPRPRDLADPALQAERSDEELLSAIFSGGAARGLSPAMPPWGHTLSARQQGHLVRYLRTLRPEPD